MESIYNKSLKDLEDYFVSVDEKKFKAKQVYDWLYIKRVASFDLMSNLKKEVIETLKKDFQMEKLEIDKAERGFETNKYLFRLYDGEYIESVLMRHDYGISVCISSQVGCNIGCSFCESGKTKKVRDLLPSEMLLQIMAIEEDIKERVSHIVIMGIGEPFDNYENVTKFIEIINNPFGINIGSRHITVSTSGIVPKIKEFSNFPYQVNLAISLHAPKDNLRNILMPINKVYPIKELMKAIKEYISITNRRVTFEYIMINEINDNSSDAEELCKLLKGLNCYINLIPYNETSSSDYKRSKKDRILHFYDIIKKNNLNVTIRREFGGNISAACGQLKSLKEEV